MTRGALKPDLSSRIGGFLLSSALHLAAGLALFHVADQGVPLRGPSGGDSGNVLVVELIPLERSGSPTGDSVVRQDGPKVEKPADPPPLQLKVSPETPREPRASGAATSDLAASSKEPGDTRQMADLPSSETLAYRQRLESHLARYRIYPESARAAGRQGIVTVYFTVTQQGHVLQAWVETSSGISDLDAEALAAVLRAQPLPALPRSWPGQLDISLPVSFRLG